MANRIVVLGGGISGLSAAYYLARGLMSRNIQHEITLLEKGRLGGWMQSVNTGGGVYELGPRSVRTAGFVGLHSLKLAEDIGLQDKIINVRHESASVQNRFIYANKQLYPLPSKWSEFIKVQPPLSTSPLSIYLKGFFKSAPEGSETMYDVVSGRFGEEVAEYYLDAFARGVFASDIRELSLKAAFPGLWYMLKHRKGKMPRKPKLLEHVLTLTELNKSDLVSQAKSERWTQWSLEDGLGGIIDSLERECLEKNVKIMKNTTVDQLRIDENQKFSVGFHSKESQTQEEDVETSFDNVDHVISTIPAQKLGKILEKKFDGFPEDQEFLQDIGSRLNKISSVDVGLVSLEYKGFPHDVLPHVGFGHLVPSCEESKVLGIVYDSCTFPEHDREEFPTTRLTCMMGGSWFKEIFGDPEHVKVHELEEAALEAVSEQLGIDAEPITVISRLHRECIPCYKVGHTDLVERMEDELKENEIPLHLGGSSYWGDTVGDCIVNSRFIADNLVDELSPKKERDSEKK